MLILPSNQLFYKCRLPTQPTLVSPDLICSWISAISEVLSEPAATCPGAAKNQMGEARLDIIDSEINREY